MFCVWGLGCRDFFPLDGGFVVFDLRLGVVTGGVLKVGISGSCGRERFVARRLWCFGAAVVLVRCC